MSKLKGIYEKAPGSGVWWIRYADATGRIRREKVGNKGAAIKVYRKRKNDVHEGKKLPETLRARKITYGDLSKDMLEHSVANKISSGDDVIRSAKLNVAFGKRAADSITPQDLERWLANHKWKPATFNRYKALVSLTYKLGINNGKASINPAKLVKTRRENNARDRFLSDAEDTALRGYLAEHRPERLPEIDIALNTGMRRGEQFGCDWSCVDLDRCILTIPRSKNGDKRYVYLNDAALAAFRVLWQFSKGHGKVFAHLYRAEDTKGAREWYEMALKELKITNFRWHDLRHTFASRLVMKGVDIRTVQELMGHKTIQITLRYAHLAPTHQLAAVQRLCDTKGVQNGATDTKTSTSDIEHVKQVTASHQ